MVIGTIQFNHLKISPMKNIFRSARVTLFLLISVLAISFNSCKKEEASNPAEFPADAQDMGQMESIFNDVDNLVAEASENGNVNGRYSAAQDANALLLNGCATITNDSVAGILTIDFGTGCVGRDGRTRSGIIQVNYSGGRYFNPGSSRTVTFINYFIDGRHVEGTRSIVNNGFNASGNMNWTITATNMLITLSNGNWHGWNGQRNREMTAGYGDSLWVNDVYLINGTGSGTNSNGGSSTSIITNLVRENSCHWIVSGTIELIPASHPTRFIDFGNGSCDAIATVTVNGNTHTIHLRP